MMLMLTLLNYEYGGDFERWVTSLLFGDPSSMITTHELTSQCFVMGCICMSAHQIKRSSTFFQTDTSCFHLHVISVLGAVKE